MANDGLDKLFCKLIEKGGREKIHKKCDEIQYLVQYDGCEVPSTLNIKNLSKLQTGDLSGWSMQCKMRNYLSRRHQISDIQLYKPSIGPNMSHKIEINHGITHCDLDQVDYKFLLCGRSDGGVAIYDTSIVTNRQYPQVAVVDGKRKRSHNSAVQCTQWFPADTGLFVSSCRSNIIKVWDANKMKIVENFNLSSVVNHHHLSPIASKHSLLAVAGNTGEISLCDLRSGSTIQRLFGHEGEASFVHWSPNDQFCLTSAAADKTIRMWDVRRGKSCLRVLDRDNLSKSKVSKSPKSHLCFIDSLCYTLDGLWLISYGWDSEILVWNTKTGEKIRTIKAAKKHYNMHDNLGLPEGYFVLKTFFRTMAVSHNACQDVVYVPESNMIYVYEVLTGKLVWRLYGHVMTVSGVLSNPITANLYTFSLDRNVITWIPNLFDGDNEDKNDSWSSDEND